MPRFRCTAVHTLQTAVMPTTRLATTLDFQAAYDVWLAAITARRGGRPPAVSGTGRVRAHFERPTSFPIVAEVDGQIVGIACGTQGIDADGDGSDVPGLCHISLVFVAPAHWGRGVGAAILEATLAEARLRGFKHTQLWTQSDNERAQRLYARHGFVASGRRKIDDNGEEEILHLERPL